MQSCLTVNSGMPNASCSFSAPPNTLHSAGVMAEIHIILKAKAMKIALVMNWMSFLSYMQDRVYMPEAHMEKEQ